MKNIDKKVVMKLRGKVFDTLGNIFEKVADNTTSSCGAYFAYEPEFPQELLQDMKEDD